MFPLDSISLNVLLVLMMGYNLNTELYLIMYIVLLRLSKKVLLLD